MKIEIQYTGINSYFVRIGDRFVNELTKDEVLGEVASALFTGEPMFLRSYTEWVMRQERFGSLNRDGQKRLEI